MLKHKKFTILEEESGMHSPPVIMVRACLRHKEIIGKSVRNIFYYRRNDHFKWCYELDEFTKVGKIILKRVLTDNNFTNRISFQVKKLSQQLHNFSQSVSQIELSKKTNNDLSKIYKKYCQTLDKLYFWGIFIEIMEVYNHLFSNFLEQELTKAIKRNKIKKTVGKYLAGLITPKQESFAQKQEKDFLRLAVCIIKDEKIKQLFKTKTAKQTINSIVGSQLDQAIDKHLNKYNWVNYNYEGPAMDKESFIDLFQHAIKADQPRDKIKEIQMMVKENKNKQRRFMQKLRPDKKLKRLIDLASEFLTLKMIRKESIFHANYATDKIREEICQRFNITLNQCRTMLPEEIEKALEKNQINKAELKAREKEMVYFCDNGKEKIYTGQSARKFAQKLIIKEKVKQVNQLQGSIASPGKVSGIVKIIKEVNDMPKMKQGDILVAMATNPTFVPAMKKAAAIITDMGGITCHAAIVSRELGVPCIVGLKIATKVLKDGDEVEVDANKGVVKIIKRK